MPMNICRVSNTPGTLNQGQVFQVQEKKEMDQKMKDVWELDEDELEQADGGSKSDDRYRGTNTEKRQIWAKLSEEEKAAAGDLTALSVEERYKFFYDRKHLIGK